MTVVMAPVRAVGVLALVDDDTCTPRRGDWGVLAAFLARARGHDGIARILEQRGAR